MIVNKSEYPKYLNKYKILKTIPFDSCPRCGHLDTDRQLCILGYRIGWKYSQSCNWCDRPPIYIYCTRGYSGGGSKGTSCNSYRNKLKLYYETYPDASALSNRFIHLWDNDDN